MKFIRSLFAALFVLAASTSAALGVGTIFGLPLSQQIGDDGKPRVGALLYIYQANTSTPVSVYEDFALSDLAPWPMETDSNGRLPQFWLPDGSYRVRLTTSTGIAIFDEPSITALGPSSGAGGGGGVGSDAIHQTGDVIWKPVDATRDGWVRANGRTIGNAASGATERANADTQTLFEYLYANCSDAVCPVSGGRSGNAATDYATNKTIQPWDMRGREARGLDDMGSTAAGVCTGCTTVAGAGGAQSHTLTVAQLPIHGHPAGSLAFFDNFTASINATTAKAVMRAEELIAVDEGTGALRRAFADGATGELVSISGFASGSVSGSVTGSTGDVGSGEAHTILDPYRLGTWYIKL